VPDWLYHSSTLILCFCIFAWHELTGVRSQAVSHPCLAVLSTLQTANTSRCLREGNGQLAGGGPLPLSAFLSMAVVARPLSAQHVQQAC